MKYVHAALLLHKQGKQVNTENLRKVIEATGGEVNQANINVLVESLKGVDIDKELESAQVVAAPASAPEAKKEEKKEEKAEEAAEGLSALFGA